MVIKFLPEIFRKERGKQKMLPEKFLERMKEMLGEEYPAFLESYEKPKRQALRINPIKGTVQEIRGKLPFSLEEIPWEKNGFCYGAEDAPGKHPYHEAGVYYIQEPSAMAPVGYLMDEMEGAGVGERILDLCAAPGGKSTQIAAAMYEAVKSGEWSEPGILISNEIHPARAKILSENIERMGVTNAVVTNESPAHLAERFASYFTRILVDAPCSGEGMFRKNEDACEEWSEENVILCADRQDEILDCAAQMLSPGGRLVYSTCTFAPQENEGSIGRFLKRHPEFSIEKTKKAPGMAPGLEDWASETIRLFPHKVNGEGHYLAVLKKDGVLRGEVTGNSKNGIEKNTPEFLAFAMETLSEDYRKQLEQKGDYLRFGDQLYLAPKGMPALKGLKVLRPGLHLGTIKKNRFEPSHALALSLKPDEVKRSIDLFAEGEEIKTYLTGGTFTAEGEKGWYLILADGFSIGWGKLAQGVMKNHYPKGLRIHPAK